MIDLVDYRFGPDTRNRLDDTTNPDHAGSVAALKTFYYALNNADLDVLAAVWSQHDLAQLNNPIGDILRSGNAVTGLYRTIFAGSLGVQVTFTDATTYSWHDAAAFAGREIGSYRNPSGKAIPLQIRTTRIFGYDTTQRQWLQVHHHGSIDDPDALRAYRRAASPRQ